MNDSELHHFSILFDNNYEMLPKYIYRYTIVFQVLLIFVILRALWQYEKTIGNGFFFNKKLTIYTDTVISTCCQY